MWQRLLLLQLILAILIRGYDRSLVLTDFSDLLKNSLGYPQSDDGSMNLYVKSVDGAILNPKSNSYWYSILVDSKIMKTEFNAEGLQLNFKGMDMSLLGNFLNVSVFCSSDGKQGDLRFIKRVDFKHDPEGTWDIGVLDFSHISPRPMDQLYPTNLYSIMIQFPQTNVNYTLHSIFISEVKEIIVTNFTTFDTNHFGNTNRLGSGFNKFAKGVGGGVIVNVNSTSSRWTSYLAVQDVCFQANTKYFRIYGTDLSLKGVSISVSLQYSESGGSSCSPNSNYSVATGTIDSWYLDTDSGLEYGDISVASLGIKHPNSIYSLSLCFQPSNTDINLKIISFAPRKVSFYANLITNFSSLTVNALGMPQGDANSMQEYEITNEGARFLPKATYESFWETRLSTKQGICYNGKGKYLRIHLKGIMEVNGYLSVKLAWSNGRNCSIPSNFETSYMSKWIRDPVTNLEIGELYLDSWFGSVDTRRLFSLSFEIFPVSAILAISKIVISPERFKFKPENDSFSIMSGDSLWTNNLGFEQGDNGSLEKYELTTNGILIKGSESDSHWYTLLSGNSVCFDMRNKNINIFGTGFIKSKANVTVVISFSISNDTCDDLATYQNVSIVIDSWSLVNANSILEQGSYRLSDSSTLNAATVSKLAIFFGIGENEIIFSNLELSSNPPDASMTVQITTSSFPKEENIAFDRTIVSAYFGGISMFVASMGMGFCLCIKSRRRLELTTSLAKPEMFRKSYAKNNANNRSTSGIQLLYASSKPFGEVPGKVSSVHVPIINSNRSKNPDSSTQSLPESANQVLKSLSLLPTPRTQNDTSKSQSGFVQNIKLNIRESDPISAQDFSFFDKSKSVDMSGEGLDNITDIAKRNEEIIQKIKMTHKASKEASVITATKESSKTFTNNRSIAIPGYLALNLESDLDWVCDNNLGTGGTSVILKARLKSQELISKHDLVEVAVKQIESDKKKPQNLLETMKSFFYEVTIMSVLPTHANIIHLIGYLSEPMLIVMKFYPTTLRKVLKNPAVSKTPSVSLKIALDIAKGMEAVHKADVLHLDLKPHNVLIDVHSETCFDCVICDFGFANFVGDSRQIVAGMVKPTSIGLSLRYASPELFKKTYLMMDRLCNDRDKKIDVYAYGITLFEIMTRSAAWAGLSSEKIQELVVEGERPNFTSSFPENMNQVQQVISACWLDDQDNRPSFQDIITKLSPIAIKNPISDQDSKIICANK